MGTRGNQDHLAFIAIASWQCLCSSIFPGFIAINSLTIRLELVVYVVKGLDYPHKDAVQLYISISRAAALFLLVNVHAQITKVGVVKISGEC